MIVAYLAEKRKQLIEQDPNLSPFFVEVYIESFNAFVPFLSIRAFRETSLFTGDSIYKTFLSSGSTSDTRSCHHFSKNGLAVYKNRSCEGWRAYTEAARLNRSVRILSLVPPTSAWPTSSLAAMIEMFSESGLGVCYVTEKNLRQEISESLLLESEVIIFGTSFHFVSLQDEFSCRPIAADHQNIVIVDTGGTKGRTESYTRTEMDGLVRSLFSEHTHIQMHSEYGMCELASQAYSTAPGHFFCNPSLQVFGVDADLKSTTQKNTPGFLAFIDEANVDSYPAIFTEDLGFVDSLKSFRLTGRAADAALKGCSLRVDRNFCFAASSTTGIPPLRLAGLGQTYRSKNILNALTSPWWDDFSKDDLALTLQDWDVPKQTNKLSVAPNKVGIVASANIPITWLFPTRYLSEAGTSEVHLFLPSIRPNDIFSERVRHQIVTLATAVAPQLFCRIVLHFEKSSKAALAACDQLLVFGQNQTLALYNELFNNVVGFGDVQNLYQALPEDSVDSLAGLCSLWHGRGCLTPVAICDDLSRDANLFTETLANLYLMRARAANIDISTAHTFNTIDASAFLDRNNLDASKRLHRIAPVTVVDLRNIKENSSEIAKSIPWALAGSGFVYLIDRAFRQDIEVLSEFDVRPTVLGKHCGHTWDKWLTTLLF